MKRWLEKYFGFTQKEIRGLCVLILFIGVVMGFPSILSWIRPSEKEQITPFDEKEIYEFLSSIQLEGERGSKLLVSPQAPIEYSEFNPNQLSTQKGVRLGLTERQIKMIQNYVAKGGHFYKKEDFKKIYAISNEDYERLLPYISIPSQENNASSYSRRLIQDSIRREQIENKEKIAKLSIELNSTDSIALQSLRGIGPVFASRIIRFRDNLGGFHDVSQLLSVYGMDEDRFNGIKDHVFTDTSLLRKININEADYETLRKHSFISPKQANVIVQYRKQHGSFSTIKDLLKIALLDEEFLFKIAPYLNFRND